MMYINDVQYIISKNITHVIILSRMGQRNFPFYLTLFIPSLTLQFVKQRYQIQENGVVLDHQDEFKAILRHFVIGHNYQNHRFGIKQVIISQIEKSPLNIMVNNKVEFLKYHYNNIQAYIRYILATYQSQVLIVFSKNILDEDYVIRLKMLEESNVRMKLMDLEQINIIDNQCETIVIMLSIFLKNEEKEMSKTMKIIQRIGDRIQYFRYADDVKLRYPELITLDQYAKQTDYDYRFEQAYFNRLEREKQDCEVVIDSTINYQQIFSDCQLFSNRHPLRQEDQPQIKQNQVPHTQSLGQHLLQQQLEKQNNLALCQENWNSKDVANASTIQTIHSYAEQELTQQNVLSPFFQFNTSRNYFSYSHQIINQTINKGQKQEQNIASECPLSKSQHSNRQLQPVISNNSELKLKPNQSRKQSSKISKYRYRKILKVRLIPQV